MEREARTAQACGRLERMREAFDKFLTLMDEKANAKNFTLALPHADEVALEKARLQFLQDLKAAIRGDLEELIVKHDLNTRLSELEDLVSEADEREKHAYTPESAELKDVWRPDLGISTAIRARVAADQESRIPALEQELAELHASNAESCARIKATEEEAQRAQQQVDDALTMLDELLDAVTLQDANDVKALETMLDALLTELGPM
ncbi:tyrosinase [Malassezia japonica]|uniref:Tyrosinase n=1 Tax=Malassezia japonica TaxID=223818 RepID=A0AAF0JAN5_9BASI|nr:tyrosinase [Malassezia japonica]WFD39628.1 tyrosinase [Malassezia japonica]